VFVLSLCNASVFLSLSSRRCDAAVVAVKLQAVAFLLSQQAIVGRGRRAGRYGHVCGRYGHYWSQVEEKR